MLYLDSLPEFVKFAFVVLLGLFLHFLFVGIYGDEFRVTFFGMTRQDFLKRKRDNRQKRKPSLRKK